MRGKWTVEWGNDPRFFRRKLEDEPEGFYSVEEHNAKHGTKTYYSTKKTDTDADAETGARATNGASSSSSSSSSSASSSAVGSLDEPVTKPAGPVKWTGRFELRLENDGNGDCTLVKWNPSKGKTPETEEVDYRVHGHLLHWDWAAVEHACIE